MARRPGQLAHYGLYICVLIFVLVSAPIRGMAAPYAALVMDARTGEVLHAQNADTRLHPASLTKMMTLYVAFQAIERGEISLDTEVTITAQAANEPPSKLGLRAGQRIRLRYLIRAAAVRSANDAATAIGIAISGSEEAFATRMNRTAAAMGMSNTTFRNAHGLTQSGHMSTARDMSVLGRHVIYDFPQYYNLFSRRTADAGVATVQHTNRRWLDSYPGGDGIKTGFTNAAGFTLVASAQRGDQRIIATVFGGTSTAGRNARITELMDMGFSMAPSRANVNRPTPPGAMAEAPVAPGANQTVAAADSVRGTAGKTIRVNGLVTRSYRPVSRPAPEAPAPDLLLSAAPEADTAVVVAAAPEPAVEVDVATLVDQDVINAVLADAVNAALMDVLAEETAAPVQVAEAAPAVTPQPRPKPPAQVQMAAIAAAPIAPPVEDFAPAEPEVVTRVSTSGGRHWGVNVGRYPSRFDAERVLLQVALNEMSTLDGSLRRVVQRSGGFDANFMGLTREGADLACRRLQARGTTCFMIGADG
ncbi:D-alanyl-D-alanine carboxypeptidase family protein [Yoonia vestfoldensis]|uniref:D-alanyl-D-alanine carboxypeptidase family protein n=1 Tax=Yoonia vestfoldensis TaxID=245188 RepID=UPI0003A7275E|nr:D-alanyl-D-alanine carboxypeptidase family protein [Yoonia vestfoldensis]